MPQTRYAQERTANRYLKVDISIYDKDGAPITDFSGATLTYGVYDPYKVEEIRKEHADFSFEGNIATVTLDPADSADLSGSYHHEATMETGAAGPVTIFSESIFYRQYYVNGS